MGDAAPATFTVTCPCCQAVLTVDPRLEAVLSHDKPARIGPAASLDRAVEAVRGEPARRDTRFREATQAERTRADLLARKFAAGLERAKDSPAPPRRPFDDD